LPLDLLRRGGTYSGIHASGFRDFLLKPELLRAVVDCGFEHPSEVQHECIPQAILGMDVICQAKSGMGKTAVFVLATLHQLEAKENTVCCLVLCHTRELAYQICNEFERFSRYLPDVKTKVFYGGVPVAEHKRILKSEPPHIIVGTPGRILQMVREKDLPTKNIKHFVLDECDKMLEQLGASVCAAPHSSSHKRRVCVAELPLAAQALSAERAAAEAFGCRARAAPSACFESTHSAQPSATSLAPCSRRVFQLPSPPSSALAPTIPSPDMRKDVQEIFKATPHEKQVMMFSATLSTEMRAVCKKFMQDPMEIYVDDSKLTLHGLQQHYVKLAENEKNRKLNELLDALEFNQVVVFVKSVQRANALDKLLQVRLGVSPIWHSPFWRPLAPCTRWRPGGNLLAFARFSPAGLRVSALYPRAFVLWRLLALANAWHAFSPQEVTRSLSRRLSWPLSLPPTPRRSATSPPWPSTPR
jgi:hypothetical protein